MKKYALKNISQIKFVDGNVEIKYDDDEDNNGGRSTVVVRGGFSIGKRF